MANALHATLGNLAGQTVTHLLGSGSGSTPNTAQPPAASPNGSLPPPTYVVNTSGRYFVTGATPLTEPDDVLEVLLCDMTQEQVIAAWRAAVAKKDTLGSRKVEGDQYIYYSLGTRLIADNDATQLAAAKAYCDSAAAKRAASDKASAIKNSPTPIHELRRTT